MSVTRALDAAGIAYVVHEHPPIRTEADLHLTGLSWEESVKTLAFELPDGRLALVAVPGPARVQYGAVARALGVSRSALRQADEERVLALGMEPGGVSPICDDPQVVVLVDESVVGMGTVYCGGGTSTTTVEVGAHAILAVAVCPVVAAVTRD
ncbi:MAG TPA: YbaK/EbsC family protein [Propionibacteriaceae bacterium]|nr:YbaK/EbsC family protein [Propionibacteriaceae bacterium]